MTRPSVFEIAVLPGDGIGVEVTVAAQQIFGGHGYIEDNGMSQFVRDARIAQIYEGANGVQALDLVGRKLTADGGKHVMAFFEMVKAECKAHDDKPRMAPFTDPLKQWRSFCTFGYRIDTGVRLS